ncbi:MAG: hypothetical protein NTZ40_02030 [Cyanobacteria bacterium]|nr:hypothetical protein [Cyanobacteriota bacterium]
MNFMQSPKPSIKDDISNSVGLILGNLATGLFALYLIFVLSDIFPIRLLDPLWMITLAGSLCNTSSIALSGLGLVHLASALNPSSLPLYSRRIFCSRFAAWAALGFLMLLPLIGYANWKGIRNIEAANKANIAAINRKANELKTQIMQASTQRDLQERMAKFQGPTLPNEVLALPLEQLKKQSLASVRASENAFENKTAGPFSDEYLPIYKQSLRAAALGLVAALSFAAGAWNPKTNTTALNSITSLFTISPSKSSSILSLLVGKLQALKQSNVNDKVQSERLSLFRTRQQNSENAKKVREREIKLNLEKQRRLAAAWEKKRLQAERQAKKRRER